MRVLVVGAGPTGLTAALELARHGILPDIVDAKEAPSWKSRAVAILPRSIEILNRTGVGDRLVAEGMPLTRARIHRGKRRLLDIDMAEIAGQSPRIIGLAQDRTEKLMSEQLAHMGVSVKYATRVQSVSTSPASAEVVFSDGAVETYDWIIGADGVGSTVRDSLGIGYAGQELSEEWSIADVELEDECDYTTMNAWLLQSERGERDAMVMVPIERNRVRLISSTLDSLAAVPITLDVKAVRRTGTFKISVRQADAYVRGRVLLAGDAAHAHSPVGGRGMNLGIEDAQAAVAALMHNTLQQYEKERKHKAKRTIQGTELARKLVTSDNPFIVVGIYVATWCIQHIGFLRRTFMMRITTL